MTTYSATIQYENLAEDYVKLSATTDAEARKQTARIAAQYPNAHVFCEFSNDSTNGYINRDGADVTGQRY